jgi:hypothetical protein
MGHQIIKQPNGKYCVFSTVVDNVILKDATRQELMEYYGDKAKREAMRSTWKTIQDIEDGKRPYAQFTKTYDEMMEWIKEVHGTTPKDMH